MTPLPTPAELRYLCHCFGLTERELAAISGASRSQVHRVLSGKRELTPHFWMRLQVGFAVLQEERGKLLAQIENQGSSRD